VDVGELKKPRTGNGVVGVDLGIKTLVTLSDGRTVANPKPLRRAQRRLARAQRRLSRRVKGSNNRKKQRLVVAKIHSRVRNIRHDVLHKVTTSLCRENQAVVIEDLTPSNMVKNHCLAKAISDASFGLFRQLLTYKAQLYGTRLIVADRFYPSSKTCSACGRVKGVLTLNERMYHCVCGLSLDRDLNAARNLVQLATACGEVTPVELSSDGVETGTKPCVLVRTN
jgi:putative transposase